MSDTAHTQWHEIRRLHTLDGVAKKELARRFGRDVKTIRRILAQDAPPSRRLGPRRERKLDRFREEIGGWLRENPQLTAREVWSRIEAESGPVSERTVRKYLADVRKQQAARSGNDGGAAPSGNGSSTDTSASTPLEATAGDVAPGARTPAERSDLPRARRNHDLSQPEYFLNRELTWLNFNFRVLHEARDPRTPLLERLKFISIVSSNLDEFFMKRIGGLKQQVGAGLHDLTVDGRTPQQQIEECYATVRDLESLNRQALTDLLPLLASHGIEIVRYDSLPEEDRAHLRQHYIDNVFPLVTPQATDPAHPFPFISNLSLNLLVTLRYPGDLAPSLARVKAPVGGGIPRFLKLPGRNVFVRMESVMAENLDLLFPGMEVEDCTRFRVTRNANTELAEDKADDLLAMIETELRERKFAPVVRLEVTRGMVPHYRGMLAAELGLDENADVFETDGMLGMGDLVELVFRPDFQELSDRDLYDPPHHPADHPALATDRNIFHVLRDKGSILLHHPYHSFPNSVERFLREASHDPKVRAIKMTLYRTSSASRVIHYLIDAATNGKQVAVVVELKARFDEAANIRWANRMEQVGIHVTYGVVGLKTHCKTILVVRRDYDGLRRYAHVGTGNYHAGTARLYSDIGLLTADPDVGRDLTELFNYLTTGYKPRRHYRKVLPAPKLAKKGLLSRIEREMSLHTDAAPGLIQFKTNALEDATVTRALYRASQAGVRVELFVRDTCRLRPGIPGLSENVRVVSVVGRFLEHARVYYFRNGGDEEYYIGSADCMSRNLNSRVELLCPVDSPGLKEELRRFLDAQASDRRSAWQMQPDGSYVQLQPKPGDAETGSQQAMMTWAESALKKATRLRRRRPRGISRPGS